MERYLVTGGAGFIGSALVHALVETGHRPRVLDDLSTGRLENLAGVLDRVEWIQGDVRDPEVAARACTGIDYVLHQAALPSVPRSLADPVSSHEVNAGGTLRLLVAARDAGVRRLVYAGSSSAYGDAPTLPKTEEMPAQPRSPYAVSKLAGEHYCRVFTIGYGLETVVLRYFNVFGPRQSPDSQYAAVIPRFIAQLRKGEAPTILGDGRQSRDFTYVDNVVRANLLACRAQGAAGETINVACGEQITLLELHAELCRLLGVQLAPRHAPPRGGDVLHSLAGIGKAKVILGYAPAVMVREGLRRVVNWTLTTDPRDRGHHPRRDAV